MAVPKLRFKEFDGDLTESKLVELTLWASGGTPAKDIPEYWGDDIPLISGASMHTNQLYESDVKITRLGLQKGSKLAPKDSILILVRGSMLFNKIPMGITLGDVAFNQDVKCIRPKQELAPQFLFQWLHAKENTIQNKVTATGIGAGKLDTADLQNLKLYKPSSEEQTKIASFLSNVDEKISQLTQKHELLNQYKQGMMQKLFSQQIRFKADDGSEFGEWEEKPLNHYLYTSKLKNKDLKFSKQEVLSVSGELGVVNQIELLGRSYAGVSVAPYSVVEHADIVYTKSPLKSNPYGIIKVNKGKAGIVSTLYAVYKCKDNIYPELIDYYFQSDLKLNHFLKPLVKKGAKNDMKVNNDHVLTGIVSLPSSLEEQTKIAYFLSAIDQKIEVVAQQIEQAKQWKKGLLQQMFV